METISTHLAKTHLSRCLAEVEAGKEFLFTRGKRTIARLSPLLQPERSARPWVGRMVTAPFHVPPEAWAALSEKEVQEWGL